MSRLRSQTLSWRPRVLSSLALFLAVGIAITWENHPFTRALRSGDTAAFGSASSLRMPSLVVPPTPRAEGAVRPPAVSAAAATPAWRPGFEWHYRWSDPRGSGTYIRAISGEEVLEGIPAYVMRTGKRSIYWSKADLAWVMEQVNGEVESQAVPSYRKFAWPLDTGKTWEARYRWSHAGDGRNEERVRRHRVTGTESVRVPAGTYQTVRVVVTDGTGKKVDEYWYAPEVRWVVKERLYLGQGVRERELIYASLWAVAPVR